jgi:glycine/D-amino acid oxidase-like deaminating enzyme
MPIIGRVPDGSGDGDSGGEGEGENNKNKNSNKNYERRGQVFVCGGLGGHGMPRCFGLGEAMAREISGGGGGDDSGARREVFDEYMVKWNVNRFFSE